MPKMFTINTSKGFSNVLDPNYGKIVAKCNSCTTIIADPNELEEHRSECRGSGIPIVICKRPANATTLPNPISEKIINFFHSCQIPPEMIDHPSAIAMFKALCPNIKLPNKEEISKNHNLVGSPEAVRAFKVDLKKSELSSDSEAIKEVPPPQIQGIEPLDTVWVYNDDPLAEETPEPNNSETDSPENPKNDMECNGESENADKYISRIELMWSGYTKVLDKKLKKNVAKCKNCGYIVKNPGSARMETHRFRCEKIWDKEGKLVEIQLNCRGFTKVFDDELKRTTAKCNICSHIIKYPKASQMMTHRLRCERMKAKESHIWEGFTKVYDEKSNREMGKCLACDDLVSMGMLIKHKNGLCRQKPASEEIELTGFTKVYCVAKRKYTYLCKTCNKLIMKRDDKQLLNHRLKCHPR